MNGIITLDNSQDEEIQLKYETDNFSSYTRSKHQNKKNEKGFPHIAINELDHELKSPKTLAIY